MNYQQAIRAIIGIIDPVLAPLVSTVIYPNTSTPVPTNGSLSWARVTIQHAQGRQVSIPTENQHFEKTGIVTIQLFQPSGRGLGSNAAVQPCLDIFEQATIWPDGLFYKDVTSSEQGTSGHWYQTNILATFDYHAIG